MHYGTGIIQYDPYRAGMKRRTQWWCVVDVDKEITRYYRWWINKMQNPLQFEELNLKQPSWDAHISVIRGEQPFADKMHLWKKYHKKKVTFEYNHVGDYYLGIPRKGEAPGQFYIVDVHCPELIQIRKEFGFKTDWSLHLTFGRTYV